MTDRQEETQNSGEQGQITGGFLFYNERDTLLAKTEQKKIEYIEARMDYSKPERILQIYRKALEERVFVTPCGLFYLKKIQDYLLEQPQIDAQSVQPIPLFHTYDRELRGKQNPARNRIAPKAAKEKKGSAFLISVILNLALVVAVIVMFVITLQSENPNVLNYEKNLLNKYASWEQELSEREQDIREKERELKIEAEDINSQF